MAAASGAIAARDQDALFARALVTAQRTAEDLVRKAKAEAQDVIDGAQTTASDIVSTARRNASEMLEKAEEEAQTIVAYAEEKATTRLAMLEAELERLVAEAHQTFQGAERSVQQSVASLSSRLELQIRDGDSGSNGNGHDPASRADGSRMAWLVPPSADDEDDATVGVGAEGTPTADRRLNRIS
jgi:cell division septum initiation protein DivIVA